MGFTPVWSTACGCIGFAAVQLFGFVGSLMINGGGHLRRVSHISQCSLQRALPQVQLRSQENSWANRAGSALPALGDGATGIALWCSHSAHRALLLGVGVVGITSHSMHSAHRALLGGLAVLGPHPRAFWWAELLVQPPRAQLLGKLKDDQ